jgi:hypothetical protein
VLLNYQFVYFSLSLFFLFVVSYIGSGLVFGVFSILLLLTMLGRQLPLFAISMIFVFLYLKNISLSVLSWSVDSKFNFTVLQGVDFILVVFFVVCFSFERERKVLLYFLKKDRLLNVFLILLLVLFLYFVLGVAKNGFVPSSVYLRLFLYPFMLFFVFFAFCSKFGGQVVEKYSYSLLYFFAFLQVFIVISEVFFTSGYYEFINIVHYFDFKFDSLVYSVSDVVDMNTRRLFNLSEFNSLEVIRPVGMTIHSISGGYILGVASLIALSQRKFIIAGFFCVFMFFFGSKGPILMFLACSAFYYVKVGFLVQIFSYL